MFVLLVFRVGNDDGGTLLLFWFLVGDANGGMLKVSSKLNRDCIR